MQRVTGDAVEIETTLIGLLEIRKAEKRDEDEKVGAEEPPELGTGDL